MLGVIIVCEVAVRDSDVIRTMDIVVDPTEYIGKDINTIVEELIRDDKCQLVKILSMKIEKKCWGCRNDAPGQIDHMDEGGCLYQSLQRSEEF